MTEEKRETKTITTPVDGHQVEVKEWITGREKRAIRKPFLENVDMSVSPEEGTPQIGNIKAGDLMEKAEDAAIQTIVMSVNGNTENMLDAVLNMKEQDYNFVVEEINKISGDENFTKPEQKQSDGTE